MPYPHTVDLSVFNPLKPLADSLSRCVHGLAADSQPYASAVAVVYQGRPMLFTAHHVVDGAVGRRLEIATPGRFEPLSLAPGLVAADAEVDAAVVRLPESALGWGISFWALEKLSPGPRAVDRWRVVTAAAAPGHRLRRAAVMGADLCQRAEGGPLAFYGSGKGGRFLGVPRTVMLVFHLRNRLIRVRQTKQRTVHA